MSNRDKIKAIHNISSKLLSNIKPKSIILFGSTAKGTDNEDSDIDLLIIWDEFENTPNAKRRIMLRKIIGINDIPLDIITCTTNELNNALRDKYSFTSQIVKEGEIIYGRLN
jgi:uncharacterized protein